MASFMKKLTEKQKTFVREYLVDMNSAAAARRAGYSTRTARSISNELMKKTQIRAAVRKALARRAKRLELHADSVLAKLAEIGSLDKTQAFRIRDGRLHLTDTDLLPPGVRACISEVAETPNGIRIKFDDRLRALELLGRHLGLWKDTLELSGDPDAPLVVVLPPS